MRVVLFDPVGEDPSRGGGTQVCDGLTVEIARLEPYRPEKASHVLRLTPDPASRLFTACAPRYVPSPEHFFRVGFARRNFSHTTRTLLLPDEVTSSVAPTSCPARLPYWDSGWDDGYSTNEHFGNGDIRTSSSPDQPITLAIPLRQLYVIGHRGAPYRFPENTLASFRAALDLGANGLELDICLTRDQRLVVFHDPSPDPTRLWYEDFPYELVSPDIEGEVAVIRELHGGGYRVARRKRMRSGSAFDIMRLSLEQVRRTYRYHHVDGHEHPLPDLEEFLRFAAGQLHRLELLFFDVKSPSWSDARETRRIRAYGRLLGETTLRYPALPARLIVAHASQTWLRELKEGILSSGERRCEFAFDASGGLAAAVGLAANPLRVAREMGNSVVSVGTRFRAGDLGEIIEAVRERDYSRAGNLSLVLHWTLNDAAQMFRSLSAGVNGIVTDRPEILRALLQKHRLVCGLPQGQRESGGIHSPDVATPATSSGGRPMSGDFLHAVLGRTGFGVYRLGLSASYLPGVETVRRALDEGVNFFFAYGMDRQMIRGLRTVMKQDRERIVLATGAYNMIWGYPNLRRTLEKRLRQFATDYIDFFLFLGVMKPKQFPPEALEEMVRFREEGKVRAIGLSTHDRVFAGQLAGRGAVDALMIRYNAAHRGAERDIFPYLAAHDTGLVSYTATRWTQLFRRPRGWPAERPVPAPGMAYRFVLSNPNVDVCLTAPTSLAQFEANLAAVRQGPLSADEMEAMRTFGDAVYRARKWFL